ncbi:hypothetical protein SAMN05216226_106100 [Halovenus aranensis]|uniref:DUF8125 domain-containing protein n=1 Tax=Halovenus aranensis TaxID=890420 RepID=A0A1G8VA81_9EURY|nr:hypothetical protein [Halovenus aranensis]SDJ63022.1 hypothetical protein SAMN05216226_106100 [Halovenus aranensis]
MKDVVPEKATSLKQVAIRDRWKLATLGAVLLIAIWFFEPNLPLPSGRHVKLFVMAFGTAALIGYPWVRRLVDWLYRPAHTHLHVFNAEKDLLAIWKLPASSWRDLDVTDHEIYPVQAAEPTYQAREYDPEENEAVGTWRGSATDLELVESRAAINDIRNDLEQMAQEGLTIRVKQSSIVRQATSDIIMEFLRDYESETVYSGEDLQQKIDDAIENWELDEAPEQPETDDRQDDQSQTEPNVDQQADHLETPDQPDPRTNGH